MKRKSRGRTSRRPPVEIADYDARDSSTTIDASRPLKLQQIGVVSSW